MNFKLAIKNLFAKKDWIVERTCDIAETGVKYGTISGQGNFFQMMFSVLMCEIRYPKI